MNTDDNSWKTLAKTGDKKTAFSKYLAVIIEEHNEGDLDLMDAGYKICGALQFSELSEVPEFKKIIELACDLELPQAHRSQQKTDEELWDEIVLIFNSIS